MLQQHMLASGVTVQPVPLHHPARLQPCQPLADMLATISLLLLLPLPPALV
jgi:hypothetical protein